MSSEETSQQQKLYLFVQFMNIAKENKMIIRIKIAELSYLFLKLAFLINLIYNKHF